MSEINHKEANEQNTTENWEEIHKGLVMILPLGAVVGGLSYHAFHDGIPLAVENMDITAPAIATAGIIAMIGYSYRLSKKENSL